MISEELKRIADILIPNHKPLGITREEELTIYWFNDKYHSTKTIIYNKEEGEFLFKGLIIKGVRYD